MTWLGGWLHELILVVLMAAFVEMLLPSKSMERYARLVLSLLVLLTMLSPLVSLLKGDATKELSVAIAQQEKSGGLLSGKGSGSDSLEQILADGKKLAAGARDQSLKLAAEEIAGHMRDQIASATGVRGANVTVTIGMGPNTSGLGSEEVPVISAVAVTLPDAGAAGGSAATGTEAAPAAPSASEPIRIAPVEPVQVNLGNGGEASPEEQAAADDSGAAAGAAGNGTEAEAAAADIEAGSIIKLLEQNWNLDPALITVRSGGASAVKS